MTKTSSKSYKKTRFKDESNNKFYCGATLTMTCQANKNYKTSMF